MDLRHVWWENQPDWWLIGSELEVVEGRTGFALEFLPGSRVC